MNYYMNHKLTALIFLSLLILPFSCDPSRVYEENIKIPEGVWTQDNPVSFEVAISDTITPYNLYINVRNSGMYPMQNLYMFITTTAPSGHSVKDTVQIMLADNKGKWLGKGLGDIWDLQRPYKKNVRFAQTGKYLFEIEQAMRMEKLPFILDVGLRIEKTE